MNYLFNPKFFMHYYSSNELNLLKFIELFKQIMINKIINSYKFNK